MDKKTLVAYASGNGATKEIAEKIGDVLRQAGVPAEVAPVGRIRSLESYDAVILGSAVYVGAWLKEAAAFLQTNEKSLAQRPVWIFSSGPTGAGDPAALLDGWRMPPALLPVAERIHPRDMAVFHGYINPDKLNFIQRWVIKSLVKKPMGDFRDWDAIASWAGTVALGIKGAQTAL